MFAIGNEELAGKPKLGKTIKCTICGKRHRVKYGNRILPDGTKEPSNLLAFFKCGGKSYLCGINGVDIRGKNENRTT